MPFVQAVRRTILSLGNVFRPTLIKGLTSWPRADDSFVYKTVTPRSTAQKVLASCYTTLPTGTPDWDTTATTSEECFFSGQNYKVRQNCTVYGVRVPVNDASKVLTFEVSYWRLVGTKYDLVGKSGDIAAGLAALNGASGDVTFATPVTGVMPGDCYSYRATLSGATKIFKLEAVPNSTARFLKDVDAAGSTQYNWGAATGGGAYGVPMQALTDSPHIVYIGDSITQGIGAPAADYNYSFIQTDYSYTNLSTYWGDALANIFGWTYQNMGHGSDTTTDMVNRFTADCINLRPLYCTIEGAVNDILTSVDTATIIANITTMAGACHTAGIIPILVPVFPDNSFNATMKTAAATVNAALPAIAAANDGWVVENIASLGQSGDIYAYDVNYNSDNYHPNHLGYMVFLGLLIDSFRSHLGLSLSNPLTLNLAAQSDGTTGYYSRAADSNLSAGNGAFWISFWINASAINDVGLVGKYSAGGNLEYQVGILSNKLVFYASKDGSSGAGHEVTVTGTTFGNVPTGQKVFVEAWYSATDGKIYIAANRGNSNSAVMSAQIYNGTSVFRILRNQGFIAGYLQGYMDKVMLMRREHDATLADWLYNSGDGRTKAEILSSTINSSSLVGYWDFDTGTGVNDLSGSAATLTVNGTISQVLGVGSSIGNPTDSTKSQIVVNLDASGNQKGMGQFTLASRPDFLSGVFNGKSAVRFSGTQFFDSSSLISTGAFSIFTPFKAQGTVSTYTIFGNSDGSSYIQLKDNTTVTICIAGGTATDFTVGAIGNTAHILSVLRDSDNLVHVFLDNIESTTGGQTIAGTLTLTKVGVKNDSTAFMVGFIPENIRYSSTYLSIAQTTLVNRYLGNYYGVTI